MSDKMTIVMAESMFMVMYEQGGTVYDIVDLSPSTVQELKDLKLIDPEGNYITLEALALWKKAKERIDSYKYFCASRWINPNDLDFDFEQTNWLHVGYGLVMEAAELGNLVFKACFRNKDMEGMREEIKKELGDIWFLFTRALDIFGFTLEEVEQANREKLKDGKKHIRRFEK